MNDQYGRRIDYMRVSVTDRCNLRCVYCMPGEGFSFLPHEYILSFEEIERVCRIGVRLGITKIKLTGGEPLVRRGIPDLVGKLKGIPGIDEVTLTTNGILLKEQINELVSNGLASVNISIDTLDERRYFRMTRGGDIKKALEGMESALKYPDLKVKVNCVPFCEEDCISLALLAKKRKIDVRFIEMMPIGNGKNFNGKMSEEIYKLLHNEFGDYEIYKKRVGNGPAEYIRFHNFDGRIGFISALSHKFCYKCNRIRLTSEGFLKPCLQYGNGTDVREMLRNGADDSLIEEKMREAVFFKPDGHEFGRSGKGEEIETKKMSQIGG